MQEPIKQEFIDKKLLKYTFYFKKGRNLIEGSTSVRRIVKLYEGK